MRGDEVFRVTARKDQWGEVEEWICNDCRFHKKETKDWVIEGPTKVDRKSVISQNHYIKTINPQEDLIEDVIGKHPKLLMDIHNISDVNRPEIDLSKIEGPAHADDFSKNKMIGNKQD